MTSVSFASNALQLTGWGLSAGDVIALAGAGRGIVTWLTSDARDNGLLDFLKVTQEDLKLRKGLLDPVALNERWSQRITIFHNGRPVDHSSSRPSDQLENVCRYTWMMTLIVAALDTSMSNGRMNAVVADFSARLFTDAVLATDYVQHEIPEHINGWRSAATTRNITTSARIIWKRLERQKSHHLPGFIPASEHHEIVRFLLWLTKGEEPMMITNSSDVHSLAKTLSDIGFDLLRTSASDLVPPAEQFQSGCLLNYSKAWIADQSDAATAARIGMRIPLATLSSMTEIISLWPEPQVQHNDLRLLFTRGQDAASHLKFTADHRIGLLESEIEIRLEVSSDIAADVFGRQANPGQVDSRVSEVIRGFTLLPESPDLCQLFESIISTWSKESLDDVRAFLRERRLHSSTSLTFSDGRRRLTGISRNRTWEQLRAFLLGYYYSAFAGIMDTSKLRIQEGFGSWSWNDGRFFEVIASVVASCSGKSNIGRLYPRHEILKAAAYLFAGAEPDQLREDFSDVAGVSAKLIILTPGLLGEADAPYKIAKFHLLDIDPTSIPCNQRGWIRSAPQDFGKYKSRVIDNPSCIESFTAVNTDPDFTAHLEPAWDYDKTLCYVVYRHEGRIIHKINALHAEAAVLDWSAVKRDDRDLESYESSIDASDITQLVQHPPDYGEQYTSVTLLARVPSDFQQVLDNGFPELQRDMTGCHVTIVATGRKPRARACLAAILGGLFRLRDRMVHNMDWYDKWSEISSSAIVVHHKKRAVVIVLL